MYLTNSTEKSVSLEADSRSAIQEILRRLWDSKVHNCVHKNPPPDSIPRQMNPIHIF
jgi:hypothetical protein